MNPKLFAKVGALLYGPSWRGPMCVALKVADRTVRRWAKDESEIPSGVRGDLAKLCREQAGKLLTMAERLAPMTRSHSDGNLPTRPDYPR